MTAWVPSLYAISLLCSVPVRIMAHVSMPPCHNTIAMDTIFRSAIAPTTFQVICVRQTNVHVRIPLARSIQCVRWTVQCLLDLPAPVVVMDTNWMMMGNVLVSVPFLKYSFNFHLQCIPNWNFIPLFQSIPTQKFHMQNLSIGASFSLATLQK